MKAWRIHSLISHFIFVTNMSDKRVPLHLRDTNNPPHHLTEEQKRNWIRAVVKAKKNHDLQQRNPPFVNASSVLHQQVHHAGNISIGDQSRRLLLLIYIRYGIGKVEFSPFLDICYALSSSLNLPIYLEHIRWVGKRPKNSFIWYLDAKTHSWGPITQELHPVASYEIFEWPIRASTCDLQKKFSGWYNWALSHCEMCYPSRRRVDITNDVINVYMPRTESLSPSWKMGTPKGINLRGWSIPG